MFRILAEHPSGLPFGKFGRPIHGALRDLGSPAPAECTVGSSASLVIARSQANSIPLGVYVRL